jgi:hypothetical protein
VCSWKLLESATSWSTHNLKIRYNIVYVTMENKLEN